MTIETAFIEFGKGPTEIIGKTITLRTIHIWAGSQHKCSEVLQNLDKLQNKDKPNMTKNKEENSARIKNDQVDRSKLRNVHITCFIYSRVNLIL